MLRNSPQEEMLKYSSKHRNTEYPKRPNDFITLTLLSIP